jgi:hypothetical protein
MAAPSPKTPSVNDLMEQYEHGIDVVMRPHHAVQAGGWSRTASGDPSICWLNHAVMDARAEVPSQGPRHPVAYDLCVRGLHTKEHTDGKHAYCCETDDRRQPSRDR